LRRARCGLLMERFYAVLVMCERRHTAGVMRMPRMGKGRNRNELQRDREDRRPDRSTDGPPEIHRIHLGELYRKPHRILALR
jgi:hypothetical protein